MTLWTSWIGNTTVYANDRRFPMKAFITITGLKFHFGSKPFEVGQKVKLVKEPDNTCILRCGLQMKTLSFGIQWENAITQKPNFFIFG